MPYKQIIIVIAVTILTACSSDNEHFCARYDYVYSQLMDPELPSYTEMKQQLQLEIEQQSKDEQKKFMLFVLEDFHVEIKPAHLEARDFCMNSERWKYYL